MSFTQEGYQNTNKNIIFFGDHFCTQSSNDIDKSFFKPSMNNSFLRRGKRINKCLNLFNFRSFVQKHYDIRFQELKKV